MSSSPKFSETLIARGQEYFEKKYGIKASKGETELWLDSLADFYTFFEQPTKSKNY
jgi:hypothetical protein